MAATDILAIPSLIGGISEQSPQDRPSSTADDQENCLNDPLNGCIARPGGIVVGTYAKSFTDPFIHEIRRSSTEHYQILIENGDMLIINLIDGSSCSKRKFDDFKKYFKHTGPARTAFDAVTVDDTTFIVNRQRTAKMTDDKSPARPNKGIFYFRSASYSTTYIASIIKGGVTYSATYTTPDNTSADNTPYIQTNVLAKAFRDKLAALFATEPALSGFTANTIGGSTTINPDGTPSNGDEYQVSRQGSSIVITGPAGTVFDLDSSDGQGDTQLIAFTDTIKKFADLPVRAPNGYIVRIQGSQSDRTDDYWLKFDGKGTTSGWEEVVKPEVKISLDASTMPLTLKNIAKNAFSVVQPKWGKRLSGDGVKTSKTPMFVNRRIRSVNFISGRMVLTTEGTVTLSRSRNAYTFFPDTAQARLDTDPISFEIQSGTVTVIKNTVATSRKLLFWGDGNQLVLDSGDSALTEESADVLPSTNYEYDGRYRPVALGAGSVMFGVECGEGIKFKEVLYRAGAAVGEVPLNDHCPTFIGGDLRQIAVGSVAGVMVALTSKATSAYIYQWLNQAENRVQTAWNTWTFDGADRVVSAAVRGGEIFLTFQIGSKLVLEKFLMNPVSKELRDIRLDHRVDQTGATYNANDVATLDLPYTVPADLRGDYVAVENEEDISSQYRGRPLVVEWVDGNTIKVHCTGNHHKFFFGSKAVAKRKFNEVYIPTRTGTLLPMKTLLHRLIVSHSETSEYRCLVTDKFGQVVYNHTFYGRRALGPDLNKRLPKAHGQFGFEIDRRADEVDITLINDTVYPSRWVQAAFEYAATQR